MSDVEVYKRIDASRVTRLTAPERCALTPYQLASRDVLIGDGDLLLVGPLGINYRIERKGQGGLVYARRWDVEAT